MLVKAPKKTATRYNIPELNIKLTKKQRDVFLSPANEIFFGGAAGPGKSFLLRVLAIYYGLNIPCLQAYLIRRLSPDLRKNHLEGITGFRSLLDPWVWSGHASVTENGFKLWHGSACFLDHCEEEKDKQKYQGPEINLLLPDELTHFTETQYRFIRGRVRLGSLKHTIPPEYRAKMNRGLIVAASNPGNIGHEWVKRTFVDQCPPDGTPVQMSKSEGGKLRAFFQALMTDNPYLEEDYADTLDGLGSADLVKAMKEGDWNVLQGAFFSEFSRMRHFIPAFKIPVHWTRIMGCDWGFWYPFCISWWAVAAEDFIHPLSQQRIPFGSLVCYRQWYGCEKPGSNLGLQLDPEVVARRILEIERTNEGPPDYRFGDPEMWKSDQKATVASLFRKKGVRFSKADNTHATGYIELKRRLAPAHTVPEIYWFDTCEDTARCFTNAVCDEKNPTEINKNCEVHACFVAGTMVRTPSGDRAIETLQAGDEVIAGDGVVRKISGAGLTRKAAPVVSLKFMDDMTVICTPDHEFLTVKGWRSAEWLLNHNRYGCIKEPWKSESFLQRSRNSSERSTLFTAITLREAQNGDSTGSFGNITLEKFLPALMSIISMATGRTMRLKTSSFLSGPNMSASIRENRKRKRNLRRTCGLLFPLRERGMEVLKVKNGTLSNTRRTAGRNFKNAFLKSVKDAALNFRELSVRSMFSAPLAASANITSAQSLNLESVLSVERDSSSILTKKRNVARGHVPLNFDGENLADVYCLTEPVTHSFTLANGVVCSNCDEARYVAMAAQMGFAVSQRREIIEINTDMTYGAMIKAADEYESRQARRKGPLEC